ncbi:MAG: helix-turn-helix domain-containing protein [Candidatus Woesearchaeota archaeon]
MSKICNSFGRNVKKYRLKKNLSQEELAELSDMHRTYISDIERGKRSISLKNIEKIANALNVKEYKLFLFEEDQK